MFERGELRPTISAQSVRYNSNKTDIPNIKVNSHNGAYTDEKENQFSSLNTQS